MKRSPNPAAEGSKYAEAWWWGAILSLCLFHCGVLLTNFARVSPTQGYDWPGHFTYLYHVAEHWSTPSPAISAQFFNPPLYYFSVAAFQRLVGLELGRAGQVFNLLLALITIVTLVMIARKLWGNRLLAGVWFIGFYVFNPTVYRTFGMVRPEAMLIPLFAVAGWIVAQSSVRSPQWGWTAAPTGILAGLAFSARQWGVFLEGAFLLWMLLACLHPATKPFRWRKLLGALGLQLVCFAAPTSLFLMMRGESVLAFNAPSHTLDLAFLTRLELPLLFSNPVRPALDYRFWPVLYADFWGDYWRYWRDALSHDPLPTSPAVVASLVRSMWAALPASWLTAAGLLFGGRWGVERDAAGARAGFHQFSRVLAAVSMVGFLIFAALYAAPDKGDTVKSVYLVYLVPFGGWLASVSASVLLDSFPKCAWLAWIAMALVVIVVMPNCFYLPPERMASHTWTMPEVQTPLNVTFGEAITLVGYDLAIDAEVGEVTLTLVWRADAYPGGRYKVFVHLIGKDGQSLAQSDAVPAGWQRPTYAWVPGEFISDTHILSASPDALSAAARIVVGLYDEADGRRLRTPLGDDHGVIDLPIAERPLP